MQDILAPVISPLPGVSTIACDATPSWTTPTATDNYYPGDDQVDWIGVGVLNYGTVASWSQWWSFKEIFGNYYPELSKYGKPIVISEFGCLKVGGDRNKWFEEAFDLLERDYTQVRGVMLFNNSSDITTTNKALDWQVQNDSILVKTLVRRIKSASSEVN